MTIQTQQQFSEDEASWDYAEVWDKFPVPARPSEEELVYLEKEIKKLGKDINILILGSTIEYRSLCKKLRVIPYVADFDRSVYEVLTNYSNEKFENENFVEIDWLDIDYQDKFDVILGHRPYNVIGKKVLEKFFVKMRKALKPGGVFFCKGNIQPKNHQDRLEEIVSEWAFKKDRKYPLFSYLEVELYFHCADKDGYVDYAKARKIANDWILHNKISQEDFALIKILISMSSGARFRGAMPEEEIKNVIKTVGFKNVEWVILDHAICANMPILKLVK